MTFIKSEVVTRATASLKEKVEEELNIPDPQEENAEAALQGEHNDEDEENRSDG